MPMNVGTHSTVPLESHLDLLLEFAPLNPAISTYEAKALELGLSVERDSFAPEYRLLKGDGFRLMLIDGHLARVHGAGLFDEPESGSLASSLGVAVVSRFDELSALFGRLGDSLASRLGTPSQQSSWRGPSAEELEAEAEVDYGFASWSLSSSTLVLLLNDEGDAHIGEWATVDIRILPPTSERRLLEAAKEVLGWPIDCS